MVEQILTVEHFRDITSNRIGFVAITDKNLKGESCLYYTSYHEVKERYFIIQKVITNRCRNGPYFLTLCPEDAIEHFAPKMHKCIKCFA
ncbi:hypothetical protein DX130_25040 [Paenibacillus paeoniae]|uniref:Uncharacterized protein n=1 Tax=Paenibacillus paeoniae TaxID=2292705 RepID=A0A371P0M0_9BACL|nr:hypothetical protein DX130_25040 [Paenibacillus paeoniae]